MMATPESSLASDAVSLATAAPRVSYAFARSHGVFPLRDEGDAVLVVARDDASVEGIAELKRVLQRPLKTLRVSAERFAAELATAYNQASAPAAQFSEAEFGENLSRDADLARLLQDIPKTEDLLGSTSDAPVIRMINALLLQALRERASDIHFEPYEIRSVVRFRVDGVLRDIIEPPRALHAALVSRLKVMASLDIAEKRLPQDGRIALKLGDKSVDVRVSTLPTGPGERVVLRLLDKDSARLDLTALGMSDETLSAIDRLIREPHGIVLVTGPTGSGKTTTLYAAMSRLPRGALNVMTVEDPIEFALDGVGQTQVNPRIELTFARSLRSILRQDPDIIMIGEIRDLETAQIAVQASLTGHLVLATLHTNDAVSADPASASPRRMRIVQAVRLPRAHRHLSAGTGRRSLKPADSRSRRRAFAARGVHARERAHAADGGIAMVGRWHYLAGRAAAGYRSRILNLGQVAEISFAGGVARKGRVGQRQARPATATLARGCRAR